MNVLGIYEKIRAKGLKLYENQDYKRGFFTALRLFREFFRDHPQINLHLENLRLNKVIAKLEEELDEKDYETILLEQKNIGLQNELKGKLLTINPDLPDTGTNDFVLTRGFKNECIIRTNASDEIVLRVLGNIIDQPISMNKKERRLKPDSLQYRKIKSHLNKLGFKVSKVN